MKTRNVTLGGAVAALAGIIVAACGGGGEETIDIASGVAIKNVTIVNTRDGTLSAPLSVIVDGGKITRITQIRGIDASGSGQVIDATGKFLVPGYNDMHTHAMVAVDQSPPYWPLFIANGVTGIREMGGSAALIQRAHKLNADAAAGVVDAPTILQIPGDIFTGQSATAAGAVAFVQAQKAAGADFVKLTAGAPPAVLAILAEAKNQGLDVAGHLTIGVSAQDSTNAGWKAIEHLGAGWGLILDCADAAAAVRGAALSGQAFNPPFPPNYVLTPRLYDAPTNAKFYQQILDTYNDATCKSLSQSFAKNGTWQVPTLIRMRTQDYSDDARYRADPNLVYVDKTRRALWEQLGAQAETTLSPPTKATLHDFYALMLKVTKLMKQNGVRMLAGSDTGGIWVIPGFSLQQEFSELAAAGLTPLEILQATTLNAAEFLHREATMGTVDVGKNADLVLLDANPLDSAANLGKIQAVVLKGKYLPRAALEQMKADVATAYANQPLKDLATALDPSHVD